jgi:hypothetical protein
MGGTCSTYGREEMHIKLSSEYLGVDCRIILICILEK